MLTNSGSIEGHRHRDGRLEITAADDEVSMSLGLALELAAHGHLTMRDGALVLAGFDPDGEPVELVYTITALVPANDAIANEGGWINLRRAG